MMNGYGFNMFGFGFLGPIINLLFIGIVVYYAVRLALKHHKDD